MSQAIETERDARRASTVIEVQPTRPPYGIAALVALAVFALYAATLGPTTWFWDTSEYITTAHIVGIPHPPGNPLFVLLARAWDIILSPTGLPTAMRINLFSALMSSGTAFFWFLMIHRVLGYFSTGERVRRIGAGVAVLISATSYTVWNQSNVNEKVYTVSLFTIAVLSWTAFIWRDRVEAHSREPAGRRWHDDNALVLMAFVLALSVGNHLMAFLAAPALIVFVLMVKPRALANWKLYPIAALFGLLGLSVHLFLPLRSAQQPIINEAAPTCPSVGSALVSIVTYGNGGCVNLSDALARKQYAKPPVSERLTPFSDQLANYFQYFDWQWSRSLDGVHGYFSLARLPFTLLFLGLGFFGAYEHYRRDRRSFAYMATLIFTLSFGLVYYLNFKYGFMQVQAKGLGMELAEVRERDYFFLVSFSLWGLWAGVGLTSLWTRLGEALEPNHNALALASPVLLLGALPLVLNWSYASRHNDYAARDWAYNLLQSVEPYGILFTNGDNDTFPLWYVQEVEGVRQDVTVMVTSYLNTDWYVRQLRDLTRPCPTPGAWKQAPTTIICQRPYVPSAKTAFYGNPPKPTKSAIPLSDAEISKTVQSAYQQLESDMVFSARGIEATLPRGTQLIPADYFALSMIHNAWGDRPVYFASTTNLHEDLGLFPFTARQGFALKLVTPQEAAGLTPIPENDPYKRLIGAYVDVPRSTALLDRVFEQHDLLNKAHWTDDATRAIPSYYGYAHLALAEAMAAQGNTPEANRRGQLAERWIDVSRR